MPRSKLLARVNFPLYTVQCLTERHILVAGGGGSSKTGIRNVIEIYELINEGSGCRAESISHYETGSLAIMNSAVYNSGRFFILFAGMEGICQLYKLKLAAQDAHVEVNCVSSNKSSGEIKNPMLRKRKRKSSEEHESNEDNRETPKTIKERTNLCNNTRIIFDIKPLESFQTDFSDDPFQKLAKFSRAAKILATAGADGHIRVWKYPEMRKLYEIHAHQDDVDDLDISPLGDKIVSVSRDGYGKVWNSENGSLIGTLEFELPEKTSLKYIYRSCRFAAVENNASEPVLFVTLNPAIRKKPPSSCYLTKWNGQHFTLEKIISTGTEVLSVMAVSDDGRFVAIGTQEGSVKIYIAFSLQLLYRADRVHGIFVTGLEFLQTSDETRRITGGHDASLISISVDNHINAHFIPQKVYVNVFGLVILFILFLFIVFVIMDYFNL